MDPQTALMAIWKMFELLKDTLISEFGVMFFIGIFVGMLVGKFTGSLKSGLVYIILIIAVIILVGAVALMLFYPEMLNNFVPPVLFPWENATNASNASGNWSAIGGGS